jgi:transposase-like protein
LPAVASLGVLFDAILSKSGQPTFRLNFEKDPSSLYGCTLSGINPVDEFDEARMLIMVAGAAKAYFTEPDYISLSRWALKTFRLD